MSTLFAIHSGFAPGVDLYSLLVKKKKYDKIKQIYKMIWEFLDFRRDDWR